MWFLYLLAFLPFVISRGRFDDRPYKPDPYRPDPYQPDPYRSDPYQPDPYKPDQYKNNFEALDDLPTDDAYEYNDEDDAAADDCNEDVYSIKDCGEIAENNWCNVKDYLGKCCASCKLHEKLKDADCYDEAQGCVMYKNVMCLTGQCRKTCRVCQATRN